MTTDIVKSNNCRGLVARIRAAFCVLMGHSVIFNVAIAHTQGKTHIKMMSDNGRIVDCIFEGGDYTVFGRTPLALSNIEKMAKDQL